MQNTITEPYVLNLANSQRPKVENYQIKLIAKQVTNYKIWVKKTGCECYFDNANNGYECLIIENIKCIIMLLQFPAVLPEGKLAGVRNDTNVKYVHWVAEITWWEICWVLGMRLYVPISICT